MFEDMFAAPPWVALDRVVLGADTLDEGVGVVIFA